MSDLLVVLTWLHVFSVVAWVGSFTYLLVVLLPTFGKVKEEGRREFLLKLLPRHESFTLVFATATIVFGLPLYFLMRGGESGAWFGYLWPGMIAGGVAYILMLIGVVPLMKAVHSGDVRMLEHPPAAMRVVMGLGLVLLLVAFTFMVMATTLG